MQREPLREVKLETGLRIRRLPSGLRRIRELPGIHNRLGASGARRAVNRWKSPDLWDSSLRFIERCKSSKEVVPPSIVKSERGRDS